MDRSTEWRESADATRAVFNRLLPKKRERMHVLSWMDFAIRAAHDVSGESWEITLDEDWVRLNVGPAELITVTEGEIRLLLPRKSDWNAIAEHVTWRGQYGAYASMPNCRLAAISASAAPVVSLAVADALRIASADGAKARRRTTWAYAHSPGVVSYLSTELKREVPAAEAQARPVRVLAASAADYMEIMDSGRREWNWIVPKDVTTGDPAVLFFGRLGFFARAMIGSEVLRASSGQYRADIVEIEAAGPLSSEAARVVLPNWKWLTYPRSYTTLKGSAGQQLLRALRRPVNEVSDLFNEGTPGYREHVSFERKRSARAACIAKHGYSCLICGFTFSEHYAGQELIVVHHLRPLSTVREKHQVDAAKDLIPVCANCHAVIHSRREPYTPDEVRAMLMPSKQRRRAAI